MGYFDKPSEEKKEESTKVGIPSPAKKSFFDIDPDVKARLMASLGLKKAKRTKSASLDFYEEIIKDKVFTEDDKTRRFVAHFAKICKIHNRVIKINSEGDFVVCEYTEDYSDFFLKNLKGR